MKAHTQLILSKKQKVKLNNGRDVWIEVAFNLPSEERRQEAKAAAKARRLNVK